MEQDLVISVGNFLKQLFQDGDKLTEVDKLALENWLSEQLESERQGWKKQLQASMKEIDKERKMTLETRLLIEELNSRLEDAAPKLGISKEPSVYHGSERDVRESHLIKLENLVNEVLAHCGKLQGDQHQLISYFNVQNQGNVPILDVFKPIVDDLTNQVNQLKKDMSEQEATLLLEVEGLREALEAQKQCNNELTKDLSAQKDQLTIVHQAEMEKCKQLMSWQKHQIDTIQTQINSRGHMAVQVDTITRQMTDNSTQVDLGHDPSIQNIMAKDTEVWSNGYHARAQEEPATVSYPYPITSVTIARQVPGADHKEIHERKTDDASSGYSDSTYRTRLKLSNSLRGVDSSDQSQNIGALRLQVVEFAHRLEQAKNDVNTYYKQMIRIKNSQHMIPIKNKSQSIDIGTARSHEGYLSGVSLNSSRGPNPAPFPARVRRQRETQGDASPTCLRCYRTYKPKENHHKACRFHNKGKQKVEKYDEHGRLMNLTYIWACCQGNPDSVGCRSGEHL